MSSPAPFAPIAELIERSVSIRHVYGDPVHHGDMTVIPVASVRMTPAGVLEIGPNGARFVRFHPVAPLFAIGAIGLPSAGYWGGGTEVDLTRLRCLASGRLPAQPRRSSADC